MKQQPSETTELTATPCPDHGRQPATVKGKASASLRRSLRSPLDERRQSVGMNQTAGGGQKCREASNMTTRGQGRKQDAQDREFMRETAQMLSRLGYTVTIRGRNITATKK